MKLSTKWEFIESVKPDSSDATELECPDVLFVALGECFVPFLRRLWPGLSEADAEEITDKIVDRISTRLASFHDKGKGSFRKWCLTIARRTAINWFRDQARQGRPRSVSLDGAFWEKREWTRSIEEEGEHDSLLDRCLMRLDPVTLTIMRMHAVDELTFAAIAKEVGMNASTARKRFQRGREELSECLGELVPSEKAMEEIGGGE
jgi:RNA polymerase sigma factor (sigma-70 family)